jgi:transcriptional regulator with XRE-family HTH domain
MTGEELRNKRKFLELTQAQLGELLGLSRIYIGMMERGTSRVHPWYLHALDALSIRGGSHNAFVIMLDSQVKAVTLNYKKAARLLASLKMHHFRRHFRDNLSWTDYKQLNYWHIEKVTISD